MAGPKSVNGFAIVKTQTVAIDKIILDPDSQPRIGEHRDTVDAYCEAIDQGEALPPVMLAFDGERHYLADGHLRLLAYGKQGVTEVEALIFEGGLAEAQWYAYGANAKHGLRLTNAEKRRAVELAVRHGRGSEMSARDLSAYLGVGKQLVADIRGEMAAAALVDEYTPTDEPEAEEGEWVSMASEPEAASDDDESEAVEVSSGEDTAMPDTATPGERGLAQRQRFEAFYRTHTAIAKAAAQLSESVGGAWMDENARAIFASRIKAAFAVVRSSMPEGICPQCNGHGCRHCRNRGYLNLSSLRIVEGLNGGGVAGGVGDAA